jgi:hypothetical protein
LIEAAGTRVAKEISTFSEMSIFESLRKEWTNQIHNMKPAEDYISETSQKELASGILKQAGEDLRRFHAPKSEVERELYKDAYCWIMSDDCSWPFSFLNICQLLQLTPDALREELLTDASRGLFGYLARRSGRAARSFQVFLNRVFTANPRPVTIDPVPLTHVPH